MFPYDTEILTALGQAPNTMADVLATMRTIDSCCTNGDGLKWFNWLYLQVTEAVDERVKAGGFGDAAWMAALDVEFARLYFNALGAWLSSKETPDCWSALFQRRNDAALARIQCALAGINAHIVHDLPQAIVTTGGMTAAHYADYTALNSTLDGLIELAKKTLLVRLLGEPLAAVSQLEDMVAAWSVGAVRETAWQNAEILAHLQGSEVLAGNFVRTLDVLVTAGNGALLVKV